MAELVLPVGIDAPPGVVFDALTDWTNQGQWMAGTAVRVTRGDGRSVGSRIVARTAAGPVGFDDPMEITGWDRPRRGQKHHLRRVGRGDGALQGEALPGGPARLHRGR